MLGGGSVSKRSEASPFNRAVPAVKKKEERFDGHLPIRYLYFQWTARFEKQWLIAAFTVRPGGNRAFVRV